MTSASVLANQQGQIAAQSDVANGTSNSNQMPHLMSHPLSQVSHHPQFQSQNQQQKQLLALASNNQRPGIESLNSQKNPLTNRNSNINNNNPNNSINSSSLFNVKSQSFNSPVNGDVHNLPELSSFLQWNHSSNNMSFSAFHNQITNSSSEHFNGYHNQILQHQVHTNTSTQNNSQNSSFVTTSSPQIKQQPQTPVMSPSPSLQQQHLTGSEMPNSTNESSNNSMVNALTAVINANNSSKAAMKLPIHQQIRMNENSTSSINNPSNQANINSNDRSSSESPNKIKNLSISSSNNSSE